MFAIINETILKNLIDIYQESDENKFKRKFYEYTKLLKESKSVNQFYEIYNMYKEAKFNDPMRAYAFIDEIVKRLRSIEINDLDKLRDLVIETEINIDDHLLSLDELVFNNNLNIYETVNHRMKLLEYLTRSDNEEKPDLDNLQRKITDKVNLLNNTQIKVIELFMKNDEEAINEYHENLINETIELISNKINEVDDILVVKKLLETNKKLTELKEIKPTISEIEQIIDLKESF